MRAVVAAVVGGALALVLMGSAAADAYWITFEDLVPGGAETGQPLTPPVAVVHGPEYAVLIPGEFATRGLELLAEDGVTDTLAAEARASKDVKSVVIGAKVPFVDYVEFMVEGDPGDLLSVVAMFARTNDLVTGVFDIPLPRVGARSLEPPVYDAGTEANTGMVRDIPFYGNSSVGPDERKPVSVIECYTVMDDPAFGEKQWCFPPGARISICHVGVGSMEPMGEGTMMHGRGSTGEHMGGLSGPMGND
jgi:hypothetical protein